VNEKNSQPETMLRSGTTLKKKKRTKLFTKVATWCSEVVLVGRTGRQRI
jgi:hypothetical protein